jgi:hypothetical protein
LGAARHQEDHPDEIPPPPDVIVVGLSIMIHMIDRIGKQDELVPADSIGLPGCKLSVTNIQARWRSIRRLKSMNLFKRVIFFCDITDDILRHLRFPELYGDPLTRFIPQRKYHFDQPFDPKVNHLVEYSDRKRAEFLRRTFNRLAMLGEPIRISMIMMYCHPWLYDDMIKINPKFDAAPQAQVELQTVRDIFKEFERASRCEHYTDIKMGQPGRIKLLEEFARRPFTLRESRLPADQIMALPGVGPERVVEVEKLVDVVEQQFVPVVPKGLKKMAQDLLNLVSLAPRLAQELKQLADTVPEEGVDEDEMDREAPDPDEADEAEPMADEDDIDQENAPKAPYDDPSQNLYLNPR